MVCVCVCVCVCVVLDKTMSDGNMAVGFLVLMSFNILFALIAAVLIAFEVRFRTCYNL